MSAHNLVIVESPAKAKTINKYLGSDFHVLASFGHIRDLPPKDGSVDPDHDFAMRWELSDRAAKTVNEITRAVKSVDNVYLATDPDREGEAIAWHIWKTLEERAALKGTKVFRVTFNEITKSAVKHAIENPRELDQELIDAYLARRALDYLVGFSLSPVLWRKLPGSRSAGRVQSVALRLIAERESEIEAFKAEEYWTIQGNFLTGAKANVFARLLDYKGEKTEKFSFRDESAAMGAKAALEAARWQVAKMETKQVRRNPFPPFITSTLQQEASRRLYFGASRTMRLAQQLYEGVDIGGETVGLITYMRTDGVTLANEAVFSIRGYIERRFGANYVPPSPRMYKSKAKNAQEAHEAIRPTDITRHPEDLKRYLDEDQLRLYTLIWQRTVACQMESAVFEQVTADIAGAGASGPVATMRAVGSVPLFPGFLSVYHDQKSDDDEDKDEDRRLPPLKEGEALALEHVKTEQHFTEPPPRYSEASLVKMMEELGIGRPSTYASILQVLQDRNYVRLDKRRFIPEDRGRLVTAFLHNFFPRYVEYDFTAGLEEQLDDISAGRAKWRDVLADFWRHFKAAVDSTEGLKISDVIDALDEQLGPHFFPPRSDGSDPRLCPTCGTGRLSLKLGKFGAFIGCSNYPTCRHTQPLSVASEDSEAAQGVGGGQRERELGTDPATGWPVSVRIGPYGPYVQLGPPPNWQPPAEEPPAEDGKKKRKTAAKAKLAKPPVKRASLPKGLAPDAIELDRALGLLALPRDIGPHPDNHEMISAGIGRFGPYLKWGGTYKTIPKDDDVLTIGLNRAVVLLSEVKPKPPAQEVGLHPSDKKPILLKTSRFGPYVQHGRVMATVPKDKRGEPVTLELAVALLAAKAPQKKGKAKAAPAAAAEGDAPEKKKPAKKAAPKKTPAAKAKTTAKPASKSTKKAAKA